MTDEEGIALVAQAVAGDDQALSIVLDAMEADAVDLMGRQVAHAEILLLRAGHRHFGEPDGLLIAAKALGTKLERVRYINASPAHALPWDIEYRLALTIAKLFDQGGGDYARTLQGHQECPQITISFSFHYTSRDRTDPGRLVLYFEPGTGPTGKVEWWPLADPASVNLPTGLGFRPPGYVEMAIWARVGGRGVGETRSTDMKLVEMASGCAGEVIRGI